ncbi:hypothetical protein C8J57DRAFT_1189964 [Mycena rebaudengoi]|nr:hypothetical protein C8J57DRAFT_1189964 [Mycena rebaudengoi]
MRTQISELDARIIVLEDSLAAAFHEREKLQSRLDEYKYPVLTLPVEIASEIFVAYLPEYPECPPMAGRLSPTVLGQVCRNWREIAFNTPWLWRAIELRFSNKYSWDAQLIVLKTWLSRSKRCPLSLSLNKSHKPSFLEFPHLTDTIISHSTRWEHIRLIFPFDELEWTEGPFPLLRHLTIGSSVLGRECGVAQRPFAGAQRLRSVVLLHHFNFSRTVLPWSQLTSIKAERTTLTVVADILREAPVLRNLECTLRNTPAAPRAVPPLVHLQSLILHDGTNSLGYNPQRLLLNALTAPALGHLSISERELGMEAISIITSLLFRSHCSLDSLHVTYSHCYKADYRAAFPSIKVLKVFKNPVDDSDDDSDEDSDSDND